MSGAAVRLPRLGRMLFVITICCGLFGVAFLSEVWSYYPRPWLAAIALLIGLFAASLLSIAGSRPDGELPTSWATFVIVTVFGLSVAVPLLLPPEHRVDAAWNWGSGAMTLLALAAFRPIAWARWLGAAHASLAFVVATRAGLSWQEVEVAVVSAGMAPFSAARFLHFYVDALRRHAVATQQRLAAERAARELDVVRMADVQRLAELRDESLAVLREVIEADGAVEPALADRARQVALRLRAALVERRRSMWLSTDDAATPLTVIAPPALVEQLGDRHRTWLAALVRLLTGHGSWQQIRVALAQLDSGDVQLVLTAQGEHAEAAASDERITSLVTGHAASVEREDDLLVVDFRGSA